MKRCIVFGSAEIGKLPEISVGESDVLISADGGLRHMERLGLTPDYLIGDFDSYDGELPQGIPIERYPSEKDDTDTALALKKGLELGCEVFCLYGCLGGDLSHTLANIQLLLFLARKGKQGSLIDGNTEIYALSDGVIAFDETKRGKLSIYSSSRRSVGVTLEGLKYSLKNAVLTNDFPLGVSNEFIGKPARITVLEGDLILIHEKF